MIVQFTVPGEQRGKERPRFVKATGRTYTPQRTLAQEARVREAWHQAGRPDLGTGPLRAVLVVALERPAGHFRVNGELSAAGRRAPYPVRKPDVDNLLKGYLDALNGVAYRDDSQVVDALVRRVWCEPGERAHGRLTLCPMPGTQVAA